MTKTIEELKATPFYKLSNEEKKLVIEHTMQRSSSHGREGAIAAMAAQVMLDSK